MLINILLSTSPYKITLVRVHLIPKPRSDLQYFLPAHYTTRSILRWQHGSIIWKGSGKNMFPEKFWEISRVFVTQDLLSAAGNFVRDAFFFTNMSQAARMKYDSRLPKTDRAYNNNFQRAQDHIGPTVDMANNLHWAPPQRIYFRFFAGRWV